MRIFLFLILAVTGTPVLHAQSLQKGVTDAYLVSRMVEKFHIQPRPLDDERSDAIFRDLMLELDEQRIFFTQDDMNKLLAYRLQLDDEIKGKKSGFLQLLVTTYKQRMLQADTMLDNICKTPFNFSLKEKYTIVIVTHSMQQAARVSGRTAFFHMGEMVEIGDTDDLFTNPKDERTQGYITGRYG